MPTPWYAIQNADEVPSPALLLYPDRVEENIRRMIALAGGVDRLRPHMKTSKIPEVVRMHLYQGITRYKVATIAEAEMAAAAGAPDVLLAYQPVGPNIARLIRLIGTFPGTVFSALVDDEMNARLLSQAAVEADVIVHLFLDLDIGMHRSGIDAGSGGRGALPSSDGVTGNSGGRSPRLRRSHSRYGSRAFARDGVRKGSRSFVAFANT